MPTSPLCFNKYMKVLRSWQIIFTIKLNSGIHKCVEIWSRALDVAAVNIKPSSKITR